MITLPMDKATFIALRERLALDRIQLADAIGVTERSIWRYEAGDVPIPEWIAKLLIMYAKHGVPESFMPQDEEDAA